MTDRYTVRRETLEAIADKIREKKYIDDPMTPAQMVEELDELGYGVSDIVYGVSVTVDPWVRPIEYPDPTVLDLTDFDGLYLTYDLRKTPGYGWIGIYATLAIGAGHRIYIERGHIENGEFVTDESFDMASGGYFRQDLDETNGEVQLWRIHSDGHFRRISFVTNTATAAKNYVNSLQPAVERYGRLPYVSDLSGTPNNTSPIIGSWGTHFLEREDIRDVTEVTTMASAYYQCYNLREIHFDGWDTSKCTNFSSCFGDCWSLHYIPLDKIKTDSATTLASMFSVCRALDNVSINHFNIDKVTSINSMFNDCRSLKHLEMSELRGVGKLTNITSFMSGCWMLEDITRNVKNLNVSNVTSLYYTFNACHSVKELDLSSWNISSKLTSLQCFLQNSNHLELLNVSGWDVSNVGSGNSTFRGCSKLRKIIGIEDWELLSINSLTHFLDGCVTLRSFKIKAWDISKLTITDYMFYDCHSLKEVELTGWDTPNVITNMGYMFAYCYSLKSLYLTNMDFTESVGTGFAGFLHNCISLEDLNISGWHIARITSFGEFFCQCLHLHEIDLTSWTVESGEMTSKNTLNNTFRDLYNCKSIKIHFPLEIVTSGSISYFFTNVSPFKYIDLRNWDLSKSTNSYTPNNPMLEVYYPPKLYPVNQSYADAKSLTPDSVVRILEALPEVAANSRTITLGQVNKLKLTEEQLAIATDKGWKVA